LVGYTVLPVVEDGTATLESGTGTREDFTMLLFF
jgi:hypothetical protein